MRQAHSVRLSDIMARLNQLRSSGELQFLDKLPEIGSRIVPPANLPPVAEAVKTPEPESIPAPQVPADFAEKKTVLTEVVEEPVAAVPEEPPVATVETAEVPVVEDSIEVEIVAAPEDSIGIESDKNDDIAVEIENIPVEAIIPETAPAEQGTESNIGGSGRRSVANDEPQALRDAAENPAVREVMDLFSGVVIDVHR